MSVGATSAAPDEMVRRSRVDVLRDYVELTKPGILVLLLVTELCAMLVARRGIPSPGLLLAALVGLGLSSGGANAVNMWYDRDIDRVMLRTQARPLPSGRLRPGQALAFGIIAEAVAMGILWIGTGILPALLSLGGFAYYVGVYTFWLKRRTPQNIVIGGGAGAFPPLIGWAAVTGHLGAAPLLMFLIIFFWTPPHFWSLALYRQEDYRRAGIPMMPVVRGEVATKRQSLVHGGLLVLASLLLYATGAVGPVYLAAAAALGAVFLAMLTILGRERLPQVTWAKRTFRFSLLYLTLLFAAMVLDVPGLIAR